MFEIYLFLLNKFKDGLKRNYTRTYILKFKVYVIFFLIILA